jgi:hypothetical protein
MPPNTEGQWVGLTQTPGDSHTTGDGQGLFVIHATLLRNGKVLWFSGHTEDSHYLPESYTWDPTQPTSSATKQPFPTGTDIFCCHQATLEDGRVITVGGAAAAPDHGRGIKAICIFDPDASGGAGAWTKIGDLAVGRWYPTLVTLPDGRLVVFSGRREVGTSEFIAASVELLAPPYAGTSYSTTTLSGGDKVFPTYPGLHLVRGGRIVHTGPTWRYEDPASTPIGTWSFRVTGPSTAAWTDEGDSPDVDVREEGMSVLASPAQDARILLFGGARSISDGAALAAGSQPRSAEILDTTTSPPAWRRTGDLAHPRINATGVLLPDGKVLVIGGHNLHKFNTTSTPSNQAELYDPILDTWTPMATMSVPRMYHSIALLIPDGRVVVAGGYDPNNPAADNNRKSLEFYEPTYMHNGPRPTLSTISRSDGPNDELAYGRGFQITSPEAASVRRVALMRPGSVTHHTDSEQRHVPLDFIHEPGTNRLHVAPVADATVAPPGPYMVWIVDDQGRPCVRAPFVRLSRRQCLVILDRSHVSRDEVASAGMTGFPTSFYVVMDGFTPDELGINTGTPTTPPPASIVPTVTFTRSNGTPMPGFGATVERLLYEIPALPAGVRQRLTFAFQLDVSGTSAFFEPDGTTPIERQPATVTGSSLGHRGSADLTLTHQPNPYLLDGATSWLSIDLALFQISDGDNRFGAAIGGDGAAARAYLVSVLNRWNGNRATGVAEFTSIPTAQAATTLELSRSRGGRRVFNFAVARVRYRGQTLPATDVRMFFRLFTTAAAATEYRSASTYRTLPNTSGEPIPILGTEGGDLATIPFFGAERVNTALAAMTAQRDLVNVRTLNPVGAGGAEQSAFFGAWLDINQTELRFPQSGGIGPFSSGLKSIQELVRGRHQCLVAELVFPPDPIPEGASPGGNDNLSQRNLVVVESDNPGNVASHTVSHTFELRPTPNRGPAIPATATLMAAVAPVALAAPITGEELILDPGEHRFTVPIAAGADELMIRWGDLPRDSRVMMYLPDVGSGVLLELLAAQGRSLAFEAVDADTIAWRAGDANYLPLPAGRTTRIPGLLTIELPPGIRRGQRYRVVLQQIDGLTRSIIGSFEVLVVVSTANLLLADARRELSVWRWILLSIPSNDRWFPVISRYVGQLGERYVGLGGSDLDRVAPSPDGDGGTVEPFASLPAGCRALLANGGLLLLLLVILVLVVVVLLILLL